MTSPFTTTFNDVDSHALAASYRDKRVEAEEKRLAARTVRRWALRVPGSCCHDCAVRMARLMLEALGLP
jgi:hypothetical protein